MKASHHVVLGHYRLRTALLHNTLSTGTICNSHTSYMQLYMYVFCVCAYPFKQDSFVHTLGNYLRQTGAQVTTVRAGPPAQRALADIAKHPHKAPHLAVLSPGELHV